MKTVLIVIFFASTAHAAKVENIGKLDSFKGKVTVKYNGEKETLKKNMLIKANSEILTENGSQARLILTSGQILNVGENSNTRITGASGQPAVMALNKGTVRGIVSKLGKTADKYKLTIKTRAATMGVRGTEFIASHQDNDSGTSFVSLDDTVDVAKTTGPNGALQNPQQINIGEFTKVKDKILPPVEVESSQFRNLKGNDVNGNKTNEVMNPDNGTVSTINTNRPVGLKTFFAEPMGMLNARNEYMPPPPKGYEFKDGKIVKDNTPQVMVDLKAGSFVPVASMTSEYEGKLYEALSKNEGYRKSLNEEIKARVQEQSIMVALLDAKLNKDPKKADELEKTMTEVKMKLNSMEKEKASFKKQAIEQEVVPALKRDLGPNNAMLNVEVQKAMVNAKLAETEVSKNDLENRRIEAIRKGDEREIKKTEASLKINDKRIENTKRDYLKVEGAMMAHKFSEINARFGDFIENKGDARIAIKNEMNGQMMLAKIDLGKFAPPPGMGPGPGGQMGPGGPMMGPGFMPPPEFMGQMMAMKGPETDPMMTGPGMMGSGGPMTGPGMYYGPSPEMMAKMKAYCEENPSDRMCMMAMGPGGDMNSGMMGPGGPMMGPAPDPELCKMNPSACGMMPGMCMPGDPNCGMMKPPWCQENPNAPECMGGPMYGMDMGGNCALEPWLPECQYMKDDLCRLNPNDPRCIGTFAPPTFGDVPRTNIIIKVNKL